MSKEEFIESVNEGTKGKISILNKDDYEELLNKIYQTQRQEEV